MIKSIADEVNRTPAQVLLRWALQKGASVIPKSGKEERIKENMGLFDFALSSGQVARIDALNKDERQTWKGVNPDDEK